MVSPKDVITEFRAVRQEPYNGVKAWVSKVEGTAVKCLEYIASNAGYKLVHVHANGNYCFGLKCPKLNTEGK